ncbi:hypothetical protein [Ignicoccus islandicus]|uniref:hypothetical protein n=1 Tax=Ignicoccus islandicus TaxID=54259 RepID=UPI0012ECDE31|nr:hypothetical protein [Ignicoccus islandicus]
MEESSVIELRKKRSKGRVHEYAYFNGFLRLKCDWKYLLSNLDTLSKEIGVYYESNGTKILLYGDVDRLVKKLVITCSVRQCTKSLRAIEKARDIVWELNYFEDTFWYSKIVENFERGGFWSVCRVVSSFRKLYKLDK